MAGMFIYICLFQKRIAHVPWIFDQRIFVGLFAYHFMRRGRAAYSTRLARSGWKHPCNNCAKIAVKQLTAKAIVLQ